MSIGDRYRISWEEACWRCDSEAFSFQCTDELVPLDHFNWTTLSARIGLRKPSALASRWTNPATTFSSLD